MPIARRHIPVPRRRRAAETAAAAVVAALAVPAVPAAAATTDCTAGKFTARSQADLAKITVLDPGPLHRELPALADVRLASSRGEADSAGKPHKSVATARYADADLLGISTGQASATATAPRSNGPASVDLATVGVAGLATVKSGTATAEAAWDDAYRCDRTGPLTRSTTMLSGLTVLGGSHGVPILHAVDQATHASRKTSLLRVGPTGSTQSATDLVRLAGGHRGVRSQAGVALGDLRLFAGTTHEIRVRALTQPALSVLAAHDKHRSTVDYRPAVLDVTSGGEQVTTLRDAGADVSIELEDALGLAGGIGAQKASVRLSLGRVTSDIGTRTVRAEAAALRVEVTVGQAHLLDVALGQLSVEAGAAAGGTPPRGGDGGYDRRGDDSSPSPSGWRSGSDSGSACDADSRARSDSHRGSGSRSHPGSGSECGSGSGSGSDSGSDWGFDSGAGSDSGSGSRSGTPAPSASAPASASASPSASVTPVALGEPLPGDGGTGGGALALTGANVAVLVLGGAALVLSGVVAFLLGRRRRSS